MGLTVAVAGASGYAGGELLRLVHAHPEMEVGAVTAHSNTGTRLGEHHPHLIELADRTLEPTSADVLSGHDVVALALPHGASGEIAARLPDDVLVLDCGADHRLTDRAAWEHFYGTEHAGAWPYGLPELMRADGERQRTALHGARRVAVPGCNVTAVTLAMAPGLAAGVVSAGDIVAVLACGPSGAGRSLKPHLLAGEIMGAATPYAVGGGHRHVPEIEQNLAAASGATVRLSFTPTLVPMSRGILATVTAPLTGSATAARDAWAEAYADEPFVHVLPEGQWPTTAAVLGANTAHVQVTVDERAGRVVAVAAIDNLTKGTAGAAVQSANIALGMPETLGLPTSGVAP
ncbi:N-acetyl-gamma-glutamyl-phosphate reductase [Haloactinopolyspora alba]|uniref:N-acetyl-gamma-glutamyl-phosphate reductase n=2 Tax=Haloactinopolyspora alba TaxID=648780 RepID=A0A2P8D2G1_9ACTN|nr:N-acetyl-gamma-glutamyl-phosphate reductase [Haloactinopolyspora alba]PSK91414.1 N-acetyl-gamma-glutamyl-phosphate reductase [Haloactinopolyspora alba]